MPVTITLKAVLQHSFPQEYKQRHEEERQHISPEGQPDAQAPVPLFVMSCLLPGRAPAAAACGLEQSRGVAATRAIWSLAAVSVCMHRLSPRLPSSRQRAVLVPHLIPQAQSCSVQAARISKAVPQVSAWL